MQFQYTNTSRKPTGMLVTGFTLIELLTVIAILGILASIVIASMSGSRERARDAARISDLQQLSLTLALYRDARGSYPPPSSGWLPSSGPNSLVPDFVPQLPADPRNVGDHVYLYATNPGNTRYVLRAVLEDGANRPNNHLSTPPAGVSMTCSGATHYCVGR